MSRSLEWKFEEKNSPLIVRTKPRLVVSTYDAAIESACQNFGITQLMSYQISRQLASGELKVILNKFELPPIPIHIVHREDRHKSARVRTFVDVVSKGLRQHKALK